MTDALALARRTIVCGIDGAVLNERERDDLQRAPFAGHVLFARNGEDVEPVRALTDAIRALYPQTPIIAIDQEGGRVARVRRGLEALPSMRALGATGDVQLATDAGEQCAHDLRRAGCNLDFAPVLDVAAEPTNTVIGTRAFSSDAREVVRMASAFADGLQRGGVMPVYKHFPGHGSSVADSHLELPEIDLDRDTWSTRDGFPFAQLARSARAMMVGHLLFPAFDTRPATLSRVWLQNVLREELGFSGVLFTDCLHMDAIGGHEGTLLGAVEALAAGADCLLISHSRELAYDVAAEIARRVEDGRLPLERVEEAVARVDALREAVREPLPLDAPAPHPGIGPRIARRAIAVLRGTAHAEATATIVVSFSGATFDGAGQRRDTASLVERVPALREIVLPLEPDDVDVTQATDAIVASGRRPMLLMRRAHLYARERSVIDAMIERFPDAMLVSVNEPADAEAFAAEGKAKTVLATFGDDAVAFAGLADAVFSRA